jgi:hypothetical protein
MPNSTNSNASCDALLDRKGGEPAHQLARSWLQYRLTLASSTVISKSKQPRAKLSSQGFPECAIANSNFQRPPRIPYRSCLFQRIGDRLFVVNNRFEHGLMVAASFLNNSIASVLSFVLQGATSAPELLQAKLFAR